MSDLANPLAPTWQTCATRCIAMTVVVLEFAMPHIDTQIWLSQPLLPLAGLVAILCINHGTYPPLGLRLMPNHGWKYWRQVAYGFALLIAVFAGICVIAWYLLGWPMPVVPRANPARLIGHLYFMCLYAPVVEEVVYRSLLTVAVLPTLGERGTIVASGIVFALVHISAGNPGPDNQIAGFLLAWAFLRSGTILVPIAMHAAGNFIALWFHVAAWYLLPPVTS